MRNPWDWFGSDPNPSTSPSTEWDPPSGRSGAVSTNTNSTSARSSTTALDPPNNCYRAPSAAFNSPSPSSLTSLPSLSPSPQPATPKSTDDCGRASSTTAPTTAKPIDIATPTRAHFADSPGVRTLFDDHLDDTSLDLDVDMTAGPNFDSAMGRSRQDSFVSAGPKPISMINPNRDQANRGRRESLAGSMMGGMSWGGISVGSFIRDE